MENYHFYDNHDLEEKEGTNQFLTLNQESPTPGFQLGLLSSGLLVLLSLAALIIAWILWVRNRHSYLLFCAILVSVFFLVSLFFAFIFFRNYQKNKKVSNYVTGDFLYNSTFLLLVLFGILFLVIGFFIIIYQPFHFNIMRKAMTNQSQWKQHWGNDFDSEWAEDKRLLLTLGLLFIAIAVCCFMGAMNLYSNVIDKADLSILLTYIALLCSFVLALVAIREYMIIRKMELELAGERPLFKDLLKILFILLIILVFLTFICAALGFLQNKGVFIICGTLLLCLALVGIITASNYTRNYKNQIQSDMFTFGRDLMKRSYKDSLCGPKYLSGVETCDRKDVFMQWEDGTQNGILNSDCYTQASRNYFFKYFRFLIFTFLAFSFCFLASVGFFLYQDYNHEKYAQNTLIIIILALMLILGIIFAFFFIFAYRPNESNTYDAFIKKQNEGFREVNLKNIYNGSDQINCQQFLFMDVFDFDDDLNEEYRVALLGQKMSFDNLPSNTYQLTRPVFYTDHNLVQNQYVLFKGKVSEISNQMNSMNVCVNDPRQAKLYLKAEKIKMSQLNQQGLTANEEPNAKLVQNDQNVNYSSSWPYVKNIKCTNICEYAYNFNSTDSQVTMIGQLLVRNVNGDLTVYQKTDESVKLELIQGEYKENVFYDTTGVFTHKINALPGIQQKVLLHYKDENGYYKENYFEVVVPRKENIEQYVQVGSIQMIGKNGRGCQGLSDQQTCENNAVQEQGEIELKINSAVNNLETIQVDVKRFSAEQGELIQKVMAGKEFVNIGKLNYGNYSLHVQNEKYFKVNQTVDLQQSKKQVILDIIEIPKDDTHRFYLAKPVAQSYVDLNLEIQNPALQSCIVNRGNPSCANAQYQNQFWDDGTEIEIIDIKKNVLANYMLFLTPSAILKNGCSEQTLSQQYIYSRNLAENFTQIIVENTSERKLQQANSNLFIFSRYNNLDEIELRLFDSGNLGQTITKDFVYITPDILKIQPKNWEQVELTLIDTFKQKEKDLQTYTDNEKQKENENEKEKEKLKNKCFPLKDKFKLLLEQQQQQKPVNKCIGLKEQVIQKLDKIQGPAESYDLEEYSCEELAKLNQQLDDLLKNINQKCFNLKEKLKYFNLSPKIEEGNQNQDNCVDLRKKFQNLTLDQRISIIERDQQQDECLDIKNKLKIINLYNPPKEIENDQQKENCISLKKKFQDALKNQGYILYEGQLKSCEDLRKQFEEIKKAHPEQIQLENQELSCSNLALFLQAYNKNKQNEELNKCFKLREKMALLQLNHPTQYEQNELNNNSCLNLREKLYSGFNSNYHPLISETDVLVDECFEQRSQVMHQFEAGELPQYQGSELKIASCEQIKNILSQTTDLETRKLSYHECLTDQQIVHLLVFDRNNADRILNQNYHFCGEVRKNYHEILQENKHGINVETCKAFLKWAVNFENRQKQQNNDSFQQHIKNKIEFCNEKIEEFEKQNNFLRKLEKCHNIRALVQKGVFRNCDSYKNSIQNEINQLGNSWYGNKQIKINEMGEVMKNFDQNDYCLHYQDRVNNLFEEFNKKVENTKQKTALQIQEDEERKKQEALLREQKQQQQEDQKKAQEEQNKTQEEQDKIKKNREEKQNEQNEQEEEKQKQQNEQDQQKAEEEKQKQQNEEYLQKQDQQNQKQQQDEEKQEEKSSKGEIVEVRLLDKNLEINDLISALEHDTECLKYHENVNNAFDVLTTQIEHIQQNNKSIKTERFLQQQTVNQINYLILRCFTGFGKKSEKIIQKPFLTKPPISECSNLMNKGEYSLEKLKAYVVNQFIYIQSNKQQLELIKRISKSNLSFIFIWIFLFFKFKKIFFFFLIWLFILRKIFFIQQN